MRSAKKAKRLAVCACCSIILSGCAFTTQQVVSDDVVRKAAEQEEAVLEYRNGFRAGYEAARRELAEALARDAEAMKALKVYRRLVYEGAMAAPEVVVIHKPERLSPDGQRYESSGTELMIRRPARFVSREAIKGLLGSSSVSLYGVFPDRETAAAAASRLQTGRYAGRVSMVETSDGRYAVYVSLGRGENDPFGAKPIIPQSSEE